MSSKKPLNFAQALRVKPGEAKQPPTEFSREERKPIEVAPPFQNALVQSVASHPTTQFPDQIQENSWQATQPPNKTSSDEWQATQPPIIQAQTQPQPNEGVKKDYSKMPSRWGKKDQNYRISAQLAERFKLTCQLNKWNMSVILHNIRHIPFPANSTNGICLILCRIF